MVKLTLKQRRSLKNGNRFKLKQYVRQDKRNARRKAGNQSSQLVGIKQGAGKSVPKPFRSSTRVSYASQSFGAFHPSHLPLPRAVGPYIPVRTTTVISTTDKLVIFGPMMSSDPDTQVAARNWSKAIAFSVPDITQAITATDGVYRHAMDSLTSGFNGSTLTPAAFSVQIMNPNALQTTAGMTYMGRFHTVPEFDFGSSITGQAFADNFVSYNAPRLCAAGKLAMRGVQIDAIPFNMSKLADFCCLDDSQSIETDTLSVDSPFFDGFAPICCYNPESINLQFLVCVEWRVRFDPTNPAQGAHRHFPPSSEAAWHKAVSSAFAIRNGVKDIVEVVANTGQINNMFG